MRIFQFLAMQQPQVTARLIRTTGHISSTVVLDLEDAIWDVTDEARTSELKAAARGDLVTLARSHKGLFERQPIGVRVNRISGPEAARDFEALARASRFVEFECVVLTKIETARDLLACVDALGSHHVACRSMVPIVETRKGLANLDEIMDAARRTGIQWLVYGHFDFALDAGWWPFPEHNEASFWEHVEPLITRMEAAGFGYVHPPFSHLHDVAGFAGIVERLNRTCTRDYGVITIGKRQTEVADRLQGAEGPPVHQAAVAATSETPVALARRIAETFLANRRPTTSFAFDPRTGEFIPPHVYLAAREYLSKLDDE